MGERVAIVLAMRSNKKRVINKNTEIYGACRHKCKLHAFEQVETPTGTDDGYFPERDVMNSLRPPGPEPPPLELPSQQGESGTR